MQRIQGMLEVFSVPVAAETTIYAAQKLRFSLVFFRDLAIHH